MRYLQLAVVSVLLTALIIPATVEAKGSSGGRSSGGSRSSVSSSSKSTSTSRPTQTSVKPTPSTPKVSKSPTSTTKSVQSDAKTIGGKKFSGKGSVVDDNYKPSFRGGYTPPAGSTVYYRDSSFMDYLPWIYIFTHDSHQDAVVVQPDGKEEVVQEEGMDSMYVINWILVILSGIGAIYGVMWLVNKLTSKEKRYV